MADETPPSAWLESAAGEQTPLQGTCYLGRAPSNNVVLSDDRVSRRHTMIHAQGQDEYWLIDLGSSNGTYLNGRRVSQPCRLADKDRIAIAGCGFTFCHPRSQRRAPDTASETDKTIQDIKSTACWLLVADIEGSTQFVKLLPLDQAPRVTGRWLAACKQIIDDHGGAINKYLGDGFFAYWFDQENAAATVAPAMQALRALQEADQPRFRLVLHFGNVFVGGSASLGEESLLGNEVNFVFRMEKLAGTLGLPRLMSDAAREKLGGHLASSEAGKHALAGFPAEFPFYGF